MIVNPLSPQTKVQGVSMVTTNDTIEKIERSQWNTVYK